MTTKQKIHEASTVLFAKKGYECTSIRDIAAKVGVTESAIYRHYDTKRAILDAIFARFKQEYPGGFMSEKQINWYVENLTARTFFENLAVCFFRGDNRFLFDTIHIICHEAPTNPAANTLVNNLLYNHPAHLIEYALNLLIEREAIPDLNVRAFSLSWAQLMISTAQRHDINCRETEATKRAWEEYAAMSSWLINTALAGQDTKHVHHIPAPVAI